MSEIFYTSERNIQIVISLLKANNVHRIIVSPGATNISFVGSIQNDSFFTVYSCVDERSAAYMACGISAETGEPVAINCTGATSSRNWLPGLTEAYYRKLPILAITSSQESCKIGQLVAQVTNRSTPPVDSVIRSIEIGLVKSESDEWDAIVKANTAFSLLTRNGGGPVHINLITNYSKDYSVKEIPAVRKITRFSETDNLPNIENGRIAICIGSHVRFSKDLEQIVDLFCSIHDAVVFCDHSSGYNGRYKVNLSLALVQKNARTSLGTMDLLIHIGEVSGDYYNLYLLRPKTVWRVSPDGEIRDLYKKLVAVFDMPEIVFFKHYAAGKCSDKHSYFDECVKEYETCYNQIPELPFSNLWIAKIISSRLPEGCVLHLGILNSLRSWNFFNIPKSVDSCCNAGGFGIDGIMSTLIGASLCNPNRLYFGVLGDLSFFYDMNSIGNRHIGNNIRILLVNNGRGQEFRNYTHNGNLFGEDADRYIAAAGHFGNKSFDLVKHYASDLGYEYLSASSKEEFFKVVDRFLIPKVTEKPMIFEVFTDTRDESVALDTMLNYMVDSKVVLTKDAKAFARNLLGDKGVKWLKKTIGK